METKQPNWEFIANLGDANPLDYGGYFVYRDTTGVYPEEAEKLFAYGEDEFGDPTNWQVYRFCLDRLKLVSAGENTYLIPFAYDESWPNPASTYDEWFHEDLGLVAKYVGTHKADLETALCSENALDRARAYEAIGDYHGYDNLDSYPLTFTSREEIEARYATKNVK